MYPCITVVLFAPNMSHIVYAKYVVCKGSKTPARLLGVIQLLVIAYG